LIQGNFQNLRFVLFPINPRPASSLRFFETLFLSLPERCVGERAKSRTKASVLTARGEDASNTSGQYEVKLQEDYCKGRS